MESRKKEIQHSSEMGLLIEVPKHGQGTITDGNTARRFFSDPKLTLEITGIFTIKNSYYIDFYLLIPKFVMNI